MLFRYKGQLHKIVRADGPERIEQEWWIQQGQHRDYYSVEDEAGQRYWLFRLGHYHDKIYQWFLHGFFPKNFYETYYFKNNEVIYARVEYKDEDGDQTLLYSKEVFYTGGDVLKEVKSGKKLSKPLRERLNFNLFERGAQRLIALKK
jgi:hypothetical protein